MHDTEGTTHQVENSNGNCEHGHAKQPKIDPTTHELEADDFRHGTDPNILRILLPSRKGSFVKHPKSPDHAVDQQATGATEHPKPGSFRCSSTGGPFPD